MGSTASRNNPHNNTTEPSTLLHHQPPTSLNLEMKSVLGLVMLAAVVLMARAQNLDCGAGFFSNGDGCCPIFLNGSAYYPGDDGCYPIITDLGVQYSDEFGCYPDLESCRRVLCIGRARLRALLWRWWWRCPG